MMDSVISRRGLAVSAAGVAALAAMQASVAKAQASGGTWFDMVKDHHAMIGATLDKILATSDGQARERAYLQKQLGYLLTAHSVAEENVLYPALARMGMVAASDQLYIEQAHAKVGNSDLEVSPKGDSSWLTKVSGMRTAILHHAKDEEEGDLFPKLMQAASPAMNALMTVDYARQFASVHKIPA
jgi:hemerythrin superfamily protein